jgi:hypothetical protein
MQILPNSVEGKLEIVTSLLVKPTTSDLDMQTIVGFTKSFAKQTLKNMRMYTGVIQPADTLHLVNTFVQSDPKADLMVVQVDHKIGFMAIEISPTLGAAYPVNAALIDGIGVYRMKRRKDYYLYQLQFDSRLVLFDNPADIDQSQPVKYTIYLFEDSV